MKIFNNLLAVCVLNVWETAAFHVVTPTKSLTFKSLKKDSLSTCYSSPDSGADDLKAAAAETSSIPAGSPDAKPAPVRDSTKAALEDRLSALEQGTKSPFASKANQAKKFWDNAAPVKVQGQTLKTWTFASPFIERVQVVLTTDGRPLDTDIELWQGPDNTPLKARIYVEDGLLRPFGCVLETPRADNTVSVRNIANMEFPLHACVVADTPEGGPAGPFQTMSSSDMLDKPTIVQGGAIRTFAFDVSVDSVALLITTDGRPLNARIELLQGPNNAKQVVELYTEDGLDRPFFSVIECPGAGNVLRVKNEATMEYPMTVQADPYTINDDPSLYTPKIGGI